MLLFICSECVDGGRGNRCIVANPAPAPCEFRSNCMNKLYVRKMSLLGELAYMCVHTGPINTIADHAWNGGRSCYCSPVPPPCLSYTLILHGWMFHRAYNVLALVLAQWSKSEGSLCLLEHYVAFNWFVKINILSCDIFRKCYRIELSS